MERAGLYATLAELGLSEWRTLIERVFAERLSPQAHGDYARWADAVESAIQATDPSVLKKALLALSPWRKGPFDIDGVHIDAEWRSDLKWGRVADAIAPLDGRRVLDVGGGNGYYALQMLAAGARCVVVIEPMILYVLQFEAIRKRLGIDNAWAVPLRLEQLPLPAKYFDTTFSMGVLYHQRSPIDHLRQLKQTLRPGGQLVLETLFLPGEDAFARTPPGRYARMKNVWLLPSIAELQTWLQRCGYANIEVVNTSRTTVDEQRQTDWMTFDSLADALDRDDPTCTVEGWPAPHRVVVIANA